MRNMRKSLILLLIIAMTANLMACAKSNKKNTTDQSAATPAAGTAVTAGASATAAPTAAAAKIDPWTFKYDSEVDVNLAIYANITDWSKKTDKSYTDNRWTKYFLNQHNIKINEMWEADDTEGAYATKLNLAIANKQIPDIIYVQSASQFNELIQAGLIQPLDDALEQYGTDYLKGIFKSYGDLWKKAGTYDGKFYGLCLGIPAWGSEVTYVRSDWMKKLNLPEPKTYQDIVNIAKAFKDKGLAKYAFPVHSDIVTGWSAYSNLNGIANSMGAFPQAWLNINGQVTYGSTLPQMKKALSAMRDLYNGGYIDKNFGTLTDEVVTEQLTKGQVGVVCGSAWVGSWPLPDSHKFDGAEWKCYTVLPYDSSYAGTSTIYGGGLGGQFLAVSSSFKHPEALILMANDSTGLVNDPATQQSQIYHSDDKDSYFQENPLGQAAFTELGINNKTALHITDALTPAYDAATDKFDLSKADESKLTAVADKDQYKSLITYIKYKQSVDKEDMSNPAENFWWTKVSFWTLNSAYGCIYQNSLNGNITYDCMNGYTSETADLLWSDLLNEEKLMYVQIISGQKDLDYFDTWVEKWKAAGGDTITKEYQDYFSKHQ